MCFFVVVAECIVALQWHSSGLKMLVASLHGNCYVYQMKVQPSSSLAGHRFLRIVITDPSQGNCWLDSFFFGPSMSPLQCDNQ